MRNAELLSAKRSAVEQRLREAIAFANLAWERNRGDGGVHKSADHPAMQMRLSSLGETIRQEIARW
ncbi:hypothetical protein OU5_P0013 (plasmid) [Pseudomonas mandelii JR-1]|uniref:Uncharacterized protein n=1 Tax=Pseudomonas mandelii JR-1 TaxID=1147786 RepID=A0A024EL27_9PSED|nr:hypothetical protein OU5_P0013 [Pseudomonas mandelii JR-1]